MSQASEMVRTKFKESDDARDMGLSMPITVERYDDLQYGEDLKWQLLDVYRPKEKKGCKLPVIVSVHGGGWVYGDKERYQYYCMSLAEFGFAVVNFTYRLAPEFQYPAPIEDTNLVMQWIMEHAEEYGLDTDNIFAVGDSAGAHNLGLYAGICTNQDYARKYSFRVPEKFQLKAIALNCGVYVVDMDDGSDDLTVQLMQDYLPFGGNEEELEVINVVNHVTENYIPTYLMTCTGDFLKNQAPLLQTKLLEYNIPHEFQFYGNKDLILGHVFHLNMRLELAHKCNKAQCDFFRSFMD